MPLPPASYSAGHDPFVRRFGQRDIVFDNEGFFNDFNDWTEKICNILAQESGLEDITARHWHVIRFLRDFYASHGRAPLNNQLKEGTAITLIQLEAMFPGGIKNGARKLAGLPNPRTCI